MVASCGIVDYKAQAFDPARVRPAGQRSCYEDVEAQDQAAAAKRFRFTGTRQAGAAAGQSPAQHDRPAEDHQGRGAPGVPGVRSADVRMVKRMLPYGG